MPPKTLNAAKLEADLAAQLDKTVEEQIKALDVKEPDLEFLDDASNKLKSLWMDDAKSNKPPKYWALHLKRQAKLIWAYRKRPWQELEHQRLNDLHDAKRHLTFLLARECLQSACPLDALSEGNVHLFVALSIEDARQAEAHLRFVGRNRDHDGGHGHFGDYLSAAQLTDDAWCSCGNPSRRGKCLQQLRVLHDKACQTVFTDTSKSRIARILEAKANSLRRRNWDEQSARLRSATYVADFYTWFNAGTLSIDEAHARSLLTHFFHNCGVVNVMELATKCFIASEHPHILADARTTIPPGDA